jgi:hypothetical protein
MAKCMYGTSWGLRPSMVHWLYTSDSLQAGRSGNQIPVGARFSAPIQTVPGAYPASCTMGTRSFPGVKRPGRGVDHPHPSSVKVKERVELPLLPLWAFMACSRVNFTCTRVIRTSIFHAALDWWPKVKQKSTKTQLGRIQRMACFAISGAIKSTLLQQWKCF